jgi:hypothetical protein
MRGLRLLVFVLVGYVVLVPVVAFLELPPMIIAFSVGAGIVVLLAAVIRRRYQFTRIGYLVNRHGRDQIEYRERSAGAMRSLIIDGELLTKSRVVYVPSEAGWDAKMPPWARGRRDQIVGRVKASLGAKGYEFEEMSDA